MAGGVVAAFFSAIRFLRFRKAVTPSIIRTIIAITPNTIPATLPANLGSDAAPVGNKKDYMTVCLIHEGEFMCMCADCCEHIKKTNLISELISNTILLNLIFLH